VLRATVPNYSARADDHGLPLPPVGSYAAAVSCDVQRILAERGRQPVALPVKLVLYQFAKHVARVMAGNELFHDARPNPGMELAAEVGWGPGFALWGGDLPRTLLRPTFRPRWCGILWRRFRGRCSLLVLPKCALSLSPRCYPLVAGPRVGQVWPLYSVGAECDDVTGAWPYPELGPKLGPIAVPADYCSKVNNLG
jgi:hypothetical protein